MTYQKNMTAENLEKDNPTIVINVLHENEMESSPAYISNTIQILKDILFF